MEEHVGHDYEILSLIFEICIYLNLRNRSIFKDKANYLGQFFVPIKLN